MFSIIVNYCDHEIGESVVHHYEWVNMIEVNSQSLSEYIVSCFVKDSIPFDSLVSDLSDITSYMSGKHCEIKFRIL